MTQENDEPTPQRARPKRSTVIAIAGKSYTDPRTVEKWLRGGRVYSMTQARLEQAVRELGIEVVR